MTFLKATLKTKQIKQEKGMRYSYPFLDFAIILWYTIREEIYERREGVSFRKMQGLWRAF